MKDQMTKKEHYVPASYLKSFVNSDNKLCVFDRVKKTYFDSYSKDICYEKYLYETPWENANPKLGNYILPNQIEDTLSKYERKYISTIKKIIKICESSLNTNALICSNEDKNILASFVVNLLLRNKWSLEQFEKDFNEDELLQNNEEIQQIDQLMNDLNFGGTETLLKMTNKKVLLDEEIIGSQAKKQIKDVRNLNCRILVSDTWQFITSSFPVLFELFDSEDGITHPKNIYVPIHPRFALLYSDGVRDRKYQNKKSIITKDEVRKLNHLYFETDIDQTRYIIAQEKFAIDDALNNDQNK